MRHKTHTVHIRMGGEVTQCIAKCTLRYHRMSASRKQKWFAFVPQSDLGANERRPVSELALEQKRKHLCFDCICERGRCTCLSHNKSKIASYFIFAFSGRKLHFDTTRCTQWIENSYCRWYWFILLEYAGHIYQQHLSDKHKHFFASRPSTM